MQIGTNMCGSGMYPMGSYLILQLVDTSTLKLVLPCQKI
jgi:hypothetical protein